MRDFRFRAYHKGSKRMLESRQQGYQGNVFEWLAEGQPVEIMQYTGLIDKNKNPIYEGDILSDIGKVFFDEKCGFWTTDSGGLWMILKKVSTEIIGNIYENPESI